VELILSWTKKRPEIIIELQIFRSKVINTKPIENAENGTNSNVEFEVCEAILQSQRAVLLLLGSSF
jgi:hypothetical protein